MVSITRSLLAGAALNALLAGPIAAELPEPPARASEVVTTPLEAPLRGHLSARRSTHDGRVRVAGSKPGAKRWFYTARPEVFRRHLTEEPRESDGARLAVDPSRFHRSTNRGAQTGHIEICDPYLAEGSRPNPFVCELGGRPADCYDVTVLLAINVPATEGRRSAIELWSTPVTITVRNPKTRSAEVARVEVRGEPVRAPFSKPPKRSGDNFLEPVTSGDGRLLIANSGDTLLYSVMPDSATPCDVRGWKKLQHLSRAPSDSRMSRYGLARYAIRDSENRRVKSGKPIRGAYPWIDRAGKNLFFTQVGKTGLFYRDEAGKLASRFPVENRPRRREAELGGATRAGMSWLGLWSEGKIVVPDTRVNNVDFHTGARGYRPRLELYEDGDARIAVELEFSPIVDLNSPESQWAYRRTLLPRVPRDVVWWLSANTGMTSEVVFDDALDNGTLIYSPMNASVDNKRRSYRDGFVEKRGAYVKNPRIQNAAASERRWVLPRFGRLVGARVEPIAAGGVTGKGLWLDGGAGRLDYAVPSQLRAEEMAAATWTTTLAVDSRDGVTRRRLLAYPDGSWVDLAGSQLFVGNASGEETVSLPASLAPAPWRWMHLAFVSTPGFVDVVVDGLRLTTLQGSYLRPGPGTITLGAPTAGDATASPSFRGWLDDFRVASGDRDPETICNWAGGTLQGLDESDDSVAFQTAGAYPAETHVRIASRLAASGRETWERYLCVRDPIAVGGDPHVSCHDALHWFSDTPDACVGPAIRFQEGPLSSDLPRPNSRANGNCRSCHTGRHPTPTLRTAEPLRAGPPGSALADDPRRQPRQAPVRIHGVVPKDLFGLPEDLVAPPEGLLLDPLLYPAVRGGS